MSLKLPEYTKFKELVDSAKSIVVVQADNPDADSLGSSIAIYELLSDMDKEVVMYCGVDVPGYLRYLSEWDFVTSQLPKKIDLAIIVDTSSETLLEKIKYDSNFTSYRSAKKVVIDHHSVTSSDILCELSINNLSSSSTAEIVFDISEQLGLPITIIAGESMLTGILGDTQGLSNDNTSADTYKKVAELIELGVNRPKLENKRKEFSKLTKELLVLKSDLLSRTEFYLDQKLAIVSVSQVEINEFSALYNPSALVMPDILQVEEVALTCLIKRYASGRITGTLRSNYGYPVSGVVAEKLGGGGHQYAAGFKAEGANYDDIIKEIVSLTKEALYNNEQS